MKLTVEIRIDSLQEPEVTCARLLREVAGRIENGAVYGTIAHGSPTSLRDENGNVIGAFDFVEEV